MEPGANGRYSPERVRTEIKKLIATVTERELEEISDTADLAEELGVDSLMAMEVMVTVDKQFKINIPEEEFVQIKNVNDAVEVVMRYLAEEGISQAV